MDEITEGFARALHVMAFADACEAITEGPNDSSIDCYDCGAIGVGSSALVTHDGRTAEAHADDCKAHAIALEGTPGPGGDWNCTAPPTSERARKVAREAIAAILAANPGADLLAIHEATASRDYAGRETAETADLESFGFALAMQWLGTGAAWADNHPDHDLEIGFGEYYVADLRDLEA